MHVRELQRNIQAGQNYYICGRDTYHLNLFFHLVGSIFSSRLLIKNKIFKLQNFNDVLRQFPSYLSVR